MVRWPDVSGYISLGLSFLHGKRSDIALVSISLAVSGQYQMAILLIKPWRDPAADHKPAESFFLTSSIRCHLPNPISIESPLIVH
jgi:hypothetical protein